MSESELNEKVEEVLNQYNPEIKPFLNPDKERPSPDFTTEMWKQNFRFRKKIKISQFPVDVIMGDEISCIERFEPENSKNRLKIKPV